MVTLQAAERQYEIVSRICSEVDTKAWQVVALSGALLALLASVLTRSSRLPTSTTTKWLLGLCLVLLLMIALTALYAWKARTFSLYPATNELQAYYNSQGEDATTLALVEAIDEACKDNLECYYEKLRILTIAVWLIPPALVLLTVGLIGLVCNG